MKIVFDFDGTLADSHRPVIAAVREIVARETGDKLSISEIEERFVANSEELYPRFGIDMDSPGVRERMDEHWRELSRDNWGEIVLFSEIKLLLDELIDLGAELYILTLRDRESTMKVLEKFNLLTYFKKLGCGDDLVQKPDPKSLTDLVGEIDPSERKKVVMIGDSSTDLALAERAQIPSIHVQWCQFAKKLSLNNLKPTYEALVPLDCLSVIKGHLAKI